MNVQATTQRFFGSLRVLTWLGFVIVLGFFSGYAALLTHKELSDQELLRNELRFLRQENHQLLTQNQQLEASCAKSEKQQPDSASSLSEGASDIEEARERSFVYTVKKGDTIWDIAEIYQVDVNDFMRWNHLSPRSRIFPGDQLTIILEE